MGILNRTNDGLHSVLVVLARALQYYGPLERERLEQRVAPPTVTDGKQVRQTLNRWLDLGLFLADGERIELHPDCAGMDLSSIGGLRRLGSLLRRLLLEPANNQDLLEAEPGKGADFTHALCWALAQDPFALCKGGWHKVVNPMQLGQYMREPRAFGNDTRWPGFEAWAAVIGFGWTSRVPQSNTFMIDPTQAVEDALPMLFGGREELTQENFLAGLADLLPVVDRGDYRRQVEARLGGNWRRVEGHEVSPSLSVALQRLEAAGRLRLDLRSDAGLRTLLGREFRPLRQVSHLVMLKEGA